MKGKTFKALLSLLMVVAMVTASGCSLLEDNSTRPSRESVESTSNREGSNGEEVDIDVTPLKVDGTSMYVTGIEKNIALREADEDTSEVLAQLTLQEEVKVIDDSSATCYFVYYESGDVQGYIKKQYLTEEKSAACKKQKAYIAKQTALYDTNESDRHEIQKLNKNSEIEILAKTSGDCWFIYSVSDKTYGYVNSMDISTSKIQENSSQAQSKAASSAPVASAPTTSSRNNGYYTGAGSTPSSYTTYYAKVNTGYLAIRTAKVFDDSNIIGKMYTGDKVYVIDTTTGTYWYCYSPNNGVYGWVNSDYLVINNPGSGNNGGTTTSDYTVWTVGNTGGGSHYLALRKEKAFDSSNEIGKLYDGQVVYVYSYSYAKFEDVYWYVYAPSLDKWGYVNSNYIWS